MLILKIQPAEPASQHESAGTSPYLTPELQAASPKVPGTRFSTLAAAPEGKTFLQVDAPGSHGHDASLWERRRVRRRDEQSSPWPRDSQVQSSKPLLGPTGLGGGAVLLFGDVWVCLILLRHGALPNFGCQGPSAEAKDSTAGRCPDSLAWLCPAGGGGGSFFSPQGPPAENTLSNKVSSPFSEQRGLGWARDPLWTVV